MCACQFYFLQCSHVGFVTCYIGYSLLITRGPTVNPLAVQTVFCFTNKKGFEIGCLFYIRITHFIFQIKCCHF